jgi:hypothetical protein
MKARVTVPRKRIERNKHMPALKRIRGDLAALQLQAPAGEKKAALCIDTALLVLEKKKS